MFERARSIALIAATAIASSSFPAPAQVAEGPSYHATYGVSDWRETAMTRAVEFKTYRTIVLANPSYSDDEKASRIAGKYQQIENAVRAERRAAYSAVIKYVAIGNSCINGAGGNGGTVNCSAKCVDEPLPNMYTSLEMTKGWWGGDVGEPHNLKTNHAGEMGDDRVQGNKVCAGRLRAAGTTRKTSYAEGAFKIRPEYIDQIVSAEVVPLMQIVATAPI